MSFFSELGLIEPIVRALDARGYSDPTPIQTKAIPPLLEGRDLLGIAQTGTGKTAAFSLPSLHFLASNPAARRNAACRMLVLAPTRELAAQIAESMRGYGKYLDLSVQCVFGGVPVGKQARALVPGCDILVATPGRLLDLIDQRALTLRHVEIFVLDEADQMMDLGFIHALKRVAKLLPEKRQSLFFSATMPKAIAELGMQFIRNPVRVEVTPQATTAERVEQYATFLNQSEKQALLTLKLREGLKPEGGIELSLVFTRTKHGADRVVRHLASAGVSCAAIHGNKSQAQRTAAIKGFRSGSIRVLVATDIAARGIDIPGVSHVFNYELPNVPEQYVHRIGRTARAGADGIAESFVAPDERPYLKDIEKLTGIKLDVKGLPEGFLAEAARLPAPIRRPAGEEEGPRQHRARGDERGRQAGGQRGGQRPRGGDRSRPEHGRAEHGRQEHGRPERGGQHQRQQPDQRHAERARGQLGGWLPELDADRPSEHSRPRTGQRHAPSGLEARMAEARSGRHGERSRGDESRGQRSGPNNGQHGGRQDGGHRSGNRDGGRALQRRDGGPRRG